MLSIDATSPTLLYLVSRLDPDAWRRLAKIYSPFVYRWCRQSGLQPSDIDDVAQEVFRSVAAGLGDYLQAPQGKFRAWLWGITRNKLRDHFRKVQRQVRPRGGDSALGLLQQLEESMSISGSAVMLKDDRLIVQRTLQLLQSEFEPPTWQAFWRTTIGNERAADIATELGMSKKAVRQAKYRVLKRLRTELELQLDLHAA